MGKWALSLMGEPRECVTMFDGAQGRGGHGEPAGVREAGTASHAAKECALYPLCREDCGGCGAGCGVVRSA